MLSWKPTILNDDSLVCWGHNSYGQLGVGDTSQLGNGNVASPTPVTLGSGRTAKAVALGYYHTCAILSDDSLSCWGSNYGGYSESVTPRTETRLLL